MIVMTTLAKMNFMNRVVMMKLTLFAMALKGTLT